MKDLVSILIPTYDGERFIAETLNSALDQTYAKIEIIIVDDCSNDDTVKIVRSFMNRDNRIKLFVNGNNQGNSYTKYRCVKESSGEYLFFLDQDDLFLKNKIEVQLNLLNTEKDINWVGSYAYELDELSAQKTAIGCVDPNKTIINQIYKGTLRLPMCSLGFRAEYLKNSLLYKLHENFFNKNIGFDHTQILLQFGFDPISVAYSPLCIYRRHANNLSANPSYSTYHIKNVYNFSKLLLSNSKYRNIHFLKLWIKYLIRSFF